MKTQFIATVLILLGAMSGSAPLFAQANSEARWENLEQLQSGQKIELIDMQLKSVNGVFLGLTAQDLTLNVDGSPRTIARTDVCRVSIGKQSHRARNAWIGFGIGAGVGAAVGGAKASGDLTRAAGALIGALPGMGIGAAAGALVPTGGRETVYRAEVKPNLAKR